MRIYLFMLSLLCCGLVSAQNTISGTVTDFNNQPVAGANVRVVGESSGTVTDAAGNFSLRVSQSPPFTLEVTSIGYAMQTVDVTSLDKIFVQLFEEETRLNEIVISASRTPERIIESPVTIERMGPAEIRNTASPTFYEGLENLKEVHFNTSSLSFKSINTRGFATVANTRFLQLVDGMDNASPALNFVLGNLVGLSDLDVASVELLPGASSALYGANAFNGILFMNSKNPFKHQGISTYFKYGQTSQDAAGTNDYYDFGIRAAHAFSKHFAAKANFTYLRATEWIADDISARNGGLIGHDLDPNYNGLNVYGDEASTNLRNVGVALAAQGLIPGAAVNLLPNSNVSRTGYRERELFDNKIESVKADFSLHFRPWDNDIEFVLQYKLGFGNTIYQGANRYALKNFFMDQTRFEVTGKNFFVRAYMTSEDAGDSYDMVFAGLNVNRQWKSDQTWFGQYAGAFVQATLNPALIGGQFSEEAKHQFARSVADQGRFLPGTPEFQNALNIVTADPDLRSGAKFIDNSKIYHSDLNYNFKDMIDWAEIMVGGSIRQFELNSQGTIFTDFDGPIRYEEYGVYTQLQKRFLAEERLKFTGSIRYDKSENFDGFVSPRVAFVYSAGESKKHNFRLSYQTGFRNPTTQDQYIGLDLGPYSLIGSAPDNLDRYVETRGGGGVQGTISPAGQAILGSSTVDLTGTMAYNNSYTIQSVQQFAATGDPSVLQPIVTGLVKPERVQAFEVGYRSNVNEFSVDVNAYYNIYNDFLNQAQVLTPYYGTAGTDLTDPAVVNSIIAIQNSDTRIFNLYTNSRTEVTSYGFGVGLGRKVYEDFELSVNYNYADFTFDRAADPSFIPAFNTPKHRLKGMLVNPNLFKNFGFNVSVRWTDGYLWESNFVNGMVPDNTVVDAQINYSIPKYKMAFKVGANNLLGKDYIQVLGAGQIGSLWFAQITLNP